MAAASMTTAQVAEALDTDPRTLRKFLRDDMGGGKAVVGKGARYELPGDKRSLNALAKRFTKWDEARKADQAPEAPATAETETNEEESAE